MMEVYAAMVDRMDQNVGRVVAELKRTGRYDNTAIIFLGDNGPEGNEIDHPSQASTPAQLASLHLNNSTGNIGAANSYVGYGAGWAQANSTPSWLFKAYTTEGGTRTTAFAYGPGIKGGRISGADLSVTDIAPTLLTWAGLQQPTSYAGHPILPYEGHSLAPLLAGAASSVRTADEVLGSELFYRRALRQGDWKIVYLPRYPSSYGRASVGDGRWKLFNVVADPGETRDLSASDPSRLGAMITLWQTYADKKGVVVPATDVAPPVTKPGEER
jgi:arylsulfatase